MDLLGAAAVVGEEHHQRVVLRSDHPQLCEDAADVLVHPIDLRRVHRHAEIELVLVLGLFPGRRLRVARRDRPPGIDDA